MVRIFLSSASGLIVATLLSSAPADASPPAGKATASPTADAAIFRAAGFASKGRYWTSGCDEPGTAYTPGQIEHVGDLNGDGRPEAVVSESSAFCYGNTGTAFWLLSRQASGSWKLIYNEVGIPEYLKTKGVGGWPDISVGGPGFCFPVMRWNGTAYVLNRSEYEGRRCKP